MSCADVCVTQEYDGCTDFSRVSMPRARKDYKCGECGDDIHAGDVHEYVSGKSDGDFWTARTCLVCAEIRKAFVCGGSFTLFTLWDDITDQLFYDWDEMRAIDCLAKLTTPAAIEKMRARYAAFREARR